MRHFAGPRHRRTLRPDCLHQDDAGTRHPIRPPVCSGFAPRHGTWGLHLAVIPRHRLSSLRMRRLSGYQAIAKCGRIAAQSSSQASLERAGRVLRLYRVMDHHTVAAISITGICMDGLGSLYLAYDLLGGTVLEVADAGGNVLDCVRRGLRPGTRSVFRFGCGDYTGVTTSIELNRTARGLDRYPCPGKQCLRRCVAWHLARDCTAC
jgi:hypothetical protein